MPAQASLDLLQAVEVTEGVLRDPGGVPENPSELGLHVETHRGREVLAHEREEVRVAQPGRLGVARPARHRSNEDLSRGGASRVDARVPQNAEYARAFPTGNEKAEAVERPGETRLVVPETD